jgi:hypothetical protein
VEGKLKSLQDFTILAKKFFGYLAEEAGVSELSTRTATKCL